MSQHVASRSSYRANAKEAKAQLAPAALASVRLCVYKGASHGKVPRTRTEKTPTTTQTLKCERFFTKISPDLSVIVCNSAVGLTIIHQIFIREEKQAPSGLSLSATRPPSPVGEGGI
ncbi:unnamed protein product [Pleuronectes platessa]|uniref:Uncharacterized protein n=1 Tax=Pleuronectes platessa TaxID=8262 RepID=A0A9N7YRG1_PLEPL|nr:unnamed protein product [Pleuronectes platessa]